MPLNAHGWRVVAVAAAVTLGLQLLILAAGGNPLLEGRLFDADCYVRLDRVLNLMQHGNWFVSLQPRIDAPAGVELNWTRPLDLLIMLGAYPLWPLLGLKEALFVWGSLVSPILLVATIAMLSWGVRSWFTAGQFVVMTLLIFIMPRFFGIYEIGRPDHHSLLALIFVVQLALFYRVMEGEARPLYFVLAGATAGLGLWVSVETLLSLGYFSTVVAMLAVWRREHVAYITPYLLGFVGVCLVALLLERAPGAWGVAIYSRFSIVHLYLGAVAAASWIAAAFAGRRLGIDHTPLGRAALMAATGIAAGTAMLAVYPDFFRGPFVGYDPAVVDDWQSGVIEMTPAWPSSWAGAAMFFGNVGPTLVALPLIVLLWRRSAVALSRVMALTLGGVAVFLPMTLLQMRWGAYLGPLTLVPLMLTLLAVLRWGGALRIASARVPLATLAAALVVLGPTFSGGLSARISSAQSAEAGAARPPCPWSDAFNYLATNAPPGWHDAIVMVDEYMGPELAWRTDTRVIASPNIDAGDGIMDVLAFEHADSAAKAAATLARRQASYVLLCRASPALTGRFARALADGHSPAWLRPVDLPKSLAADFRLYHLDP